MIVHKSVTLSRPPDVAFKIFVEEMTQWWPLDKYSFLGPDSTLTIEPRAGGRFVETSPDGREYLIGEVLRYEPGTGLTFTWTHREGKGVTEIDILFTAEGNGTRIDVAHSGFEKLADPEQMSAGYGAGWDEILAEFVRHADASK
jgi:uncharacterized protein YndB with AHSA1/START domain